MQRAEHAVDGGVPQVRGDAGGEQVRLAGLDAGQDPQVGEPVAALGELGEVALDVDRQLLGGVPVDQALRVAASSSCQTVKSRCSVKAMAGRPSSTACSQARRIVEESAVSHDQWVWTWLSGGLITCGFSSAVPRLRAALSARRPFCRPRLPTVVGMSTAAPPSEIAGSVHAEALADPARADRPPDAEFREGQDAAVAALVERSQRALVVQRTGWGKSAVYFVSTALLRRRGKGRRCWSARCSR